MAIKRHRFPPLPDTGNRGSLVDVRDVARALVLIAYHFQCGRYVKALLDHSDEHSHTYYRFFNEVPVLFLFAMVILAVLKPF